MRSSCLLAVVLAACLLCCGCAFLAPTPCGGDGNSQDCPARCREAKGKAAACPDPMLCLAHEVTVLEDDIRRDGSITVKTPDVWGDGDLMHYIEEYDGLLAESVKKFEETLQAYIARSDQMELQSATGLGLAGEGGVAPIPNPTKIEIDNKGAVSSSGTLTPELKDLPTVDLFDLIAKAQKAAPPVAKGVGVEPTELERQHSTFILVNQALRRRNMGDDGSRAAGYGLYKFRVPVSVLPGCETREGYSAIVTLRARLHVDEANLRYTFPKLAIADLVEVLTPVILEDWGKNDANTAKDEVQRQSESRRQLEANVKILSESADAIQRAAAQFANLKCAAEAVRSASTSAVQAVEGTAWSAAEAATAFESARAQVDSLIRNIPDSAQKNRLIEACVAASKGIAAANAIHQITQRSEPARAPALSIPVDPVWAKAVFGEVSVRDVRTTAEKFFARGKPKSLELRNFLFKYLGQVHSVLEACHLYGASGEAGCCDYLIRAIGRNVERGCDPGVFRTAWIDHVAAGQQCRNLTIPGLPSASWLLAVQSGILDRNLHRILADLQLRGKLCCDPGLLEAVQFFYPQGCPEAARLWEILVRETFPLHVFTLDPEVEEQNVYDAFSRRREMQMALAISVARGRINAGQKVALSRQLALDEATIAMNRTVVGFCHGNDTFGWYFYPRVQTPPTESSNIAALARMIWSTGPTECYDLRHRKIEPGMRECEVLVAMPSFVNEVCFDVTTNWESLAHPGLGKRSYEEMVCQGGRVQRLRMGLCNAGNLHCYRPGDHERLVSRVDQLEQMLGMQTYVVNVPYQYEQTGTDLFDTGSKHLRPTLHGYYGLQFLQGDVDGPAYVFLQGKNFHPTLTHVIVGGAESHYSASGDVEIISREVLRVKIGKLNSSLSPQGSFEVRVATPAGISDPLTIPTRKVPETASAFDWKEPPVFMGQLALVRGNAAQVELVGVVPAPDALEIVNQTPYLPTPEVNSETHIVLVLAVTFAKSGKRIDLGPTETIAVTNGRGLLVDRNALLGMINAKIRNGGLTPYGETEAELKATTYLRFDRWPYVEFRTPVVIKITTPTVKAGGRIEPAEQRSDLRRLPPPPPAVNGPEWREPPIPPPPGEPRVRDR